MALSGSMELTNNFGTKTKFDSVYIKAREVTADKLTALVTVGVYEGKDGRLLTDIQYPFAPSVADDSENFIRQAYGHIKTLPEFADATDC